MQKKFYKNSFIVFVSGTLSLCFCWFFWYPYYGILVTLFSLSLAIVGTIVGQRKIKSLEKSIEPIDQLELKNLRISYFISIIGIIISFVCIILALLFTYYFKILN